MITKELKVWIGTPQGVPPVARLSQYDTAWRFVFTVYNGSEPWIIPSGAAVVLNGRKSDGTVFSYAGKLEGANAVVDCGTQITSAKGDVECELRFSSNSEIVGTANFVLKVEAAPMSGYVASNSDFSAVDQLVNQTLVIAEQVGTIKQVLDSVNTQLSDLKSAVGSPLTATTGAAMSDTDKVYVYTGTNTANFTNGHWYYYDTTAGKWTAGGVYNSFALETDKTLSVEGAAADAKVVGGINSAVETYVTRLPPDYIELEYIQSADDTSISLNMRGTEKTRVVCDFSYVENSNERTTNYLFGARGSTTSNALTFGISRGAMSYSVGWNNTTKTIDVEADHYRHTVDWDKNNIYIDGKLIYSNNDAAFTTPYNMHLFGVRGGASSYYYGDFKVFHCDVYENNALILRLIPAKRLLDSAVGFYDLVSGAFLTGTDAQRDRWIVGRVLSAKSVYDELVQTQDRIAQKKAEVDSEDLPKDYVITEAERVAEKIRSVQNPNTLTMLCLSDMHYKEGDDVIYYALKDMANGAKEIAKQTNIDLFVSAGDVIWRMSDDGDFEIGKQEMIAGTRILNTLFANSQQVRLVGNHDINSQGPTGYFANNQLWSYFGAYNGWATDPEHKSENYGYVESNRLKIRIICLNTSNYTSTPTQDSTIYAVTQHQMLWFAHALDLSDKGDADEWSIIVMSHVALDRYNTIRYMRIINAYINGESVSVPNTTVTYDYAGKNLAKLKVWVHGHTHNFLVDNLYWADSSITKLPVARIALPNALPGREMAATGNPDENGIQWHNGEIFEKSPNTANSTAFTINVFDVFEDVLYSFCYGAGCDRILHFASHAVTGATTLSPSITPTTWSSMDSAVAVAANGVVSPVGSGNVLVYAVDDNGTKEYWNLSVQV